MPRPLSYRDRYANMLASQGTIAPYEPSFAERIGSGIRQIGGEQKFQDFEKLGGFIPGIGEAMDTDAVKRYAEAGNYGDAAMTAALGVLPGSAVKAKDLIKGGAKKAVKVAQQLAGSPYLTDPIREFAPGIYKKPQQLAEEAAAMHAPENPALQELFGVSRGDLAEIGEYGTRKGNIEPSIKSAANPKGSRAASAVMTPQNAERMVAALEGGKKYAPDLMRDMGSWYVMDPAYWQLEKLVGPDEAKRLYTRLNTTTGMHSAGSEVMTEINRGTAANMMMERGDFPTYAKYGGMAEAKRGRNFPEELRGVKGHAYHSTSHVLPLQKYMAKGEVDMGSPKVPLYIQASGVPATGFQTKSPVADAHFTRALGMADVRTTADPGVSMKMPEYTPIPDWYRQNVAGPAGVEAVPAQAQQWGLYAPQTGVTTPIGAPKLELLAQRIWERGKEMGLNPTQIKKLRDDVLTGKAHASWLMPLLGVGGVAAATQKETGGSDGNHTPPAGSSINPY